MTIDKATKNFQESLIQLINSSNLPISSVYFILKDCFREVEMAYINSSNKADEEVETEVQDTGVEIQGDEVE